MYSRIGVSTISRNFEKLNSKSKIYQLRPTNLRVGTIVRTYHSLGSADTRQALHHIHRQHYVPNDKHDESILLSRVASILHLVGDPWTNCYQLGQTNLRVGTIVHTHHSRLN
jgi:hypothetical protein